MLLTRKRMREKKAPHQIKPKLLVLQIKTLLPNEQRILLTFDNNSAVMF